MTQRVNLPMWGRQSLPNRRIELGEWLMYYLFMMRIHLSEVFENGKTQFVYKE